MVKKDLSYNSTKGKHRHIHGYKDHSNKASDA